MTSGRPSGLNKTLINYKSYQKQKSNVSTSLSKQEIAQENLFKKYAIKHVLPDEHYDVLAKLMVGDLGNNSLSNPVTNTIEGDVIEILLGAEIDAMHLGYKVDQKGQKIANKRNGYRKGILCYGTSPKDAKHYFAYNRPRFRSGDFKSRFIPPRTRYISAKYGEFLSLLLKSHELTFEEVVESLEAVFHTAYSEDQYRAILRIFFKQFAYYASSILRNHLYYVLPVVVTAKNFNERELALIGNHKFKTIYFAVGYNSNHNYLFLGQYFSNDYPKNESEARKFLRQLAKTLENKNMEASTVLTDGMAGGMTHFSAEHIRKFIPCRQVANYSKLIDDFYAPASEAEASSLPSEEAKEITSPEAGSLEEESKK